MAKKRAIIGLRGIALAKVTENEITGYSSAAATINLPYAGAMNRTAKEKKQDIYYDDTLYAQINEVTGEDVEIRLGEVDPATLAELGLGSYDDTTGIFEGSFTPAQETYSLRMITDTLGKLPTYWNYRVFDLTGWKYDNFSTKGDSINVCEVIITGVFKEPAMPTVKPYAYMRLDEDEDNKAACEAFLANGETFPKV